MILVDANILIDIVGRNTEWFDWSSAALAKALEAGAFTNHVVVAELAGRARSVEELAQMMVFLRVPVAALGLSAAFLASRAFVQWIKNGGRRGAMLPDFLIGGHAAAAGAKILTRDPRRFRYYFPDLELIAPGTRHG